MRRLRGLSSAILNGSARDKPLFQVEDHLCGDLGRDAGDDRASLRTVPAGVMKRFSLFRDIKPVSLPVADLVNLGAEGVTDLISEGVVDPHGGLHGLLGLLSIWESFPAHERADGHDGPDEGSACLPVPGNAAGETTPGLKDIVTDNPGLFLQSCKNGLRSAAVVHFIEEGRLVSLFKKFISVFGLQRSPPCEFRLKINVTSNLK